MTPGLSEADGPDGPLVDFVLACDEALAAGQAPPTCPTLAPEQQTWLSGVEACLRRLEEDRRNQGGADAAPRRLGRYTLLKLLGQGGMGTVYLAEDPSLQRRVALKVMRPALAAHAEARARFLREARAVARLKSDHVATIYDVGEEADVPFLAMELLQGESLESWLQRQPRASAEQAIRLAVDMARGLAAVHAEGLVHRDIKPANLWVEAPTERVKVLDFGLATGAPGDVQLTAAGAMLGTPAYMAPEQAEGQPPDARSDLFSLGCVLYRLCTGEAPFAGPTLLAILKAQATQEPRSVSAVNRAIPEPFARLIHRLLAKRPEDRPPSAAAVVEELRLLRPAPPAQRRRFALTGRSRLVLAAAGGLGLLLVSLLVLKRGFGVGDPSVGRTTSPSTEAAITNSIGMKLVRLRPGKFIMGAPPDEPGYDPHEGPQHRVEITRPFYLGAYEVTVGEFAAFVKDRRYQTDADTIGWARIQQPDGKWFDVPKANWRNPGFAQTDRHPVVCVSWNDAAAFCDWLSKKEGRAYDLPTEAEWEYCCRAGTQTAYAFGSAPAVLYSWYGANAEGKTHPVGELRPNAWGLYDMNGNADEWVRDRYGKDYYRESPLQDPPGPSTGPIRVLRGDCWYGNHPNRAAGRYGYHAPSDRFSIFGFRVALYPVAGHVD